MLKLEEPLYIRIINTYVGRSPTSTITKTLLGAAFSMQYLLTNGSAVTDYEQTWSIKMSPFFTFIQSFQVKRIENYQFTINTIWTPASTALVFFTREQNVYIFGSCCNFIYGSNEFFVARQFMNFRHSVSILSKLVTQRILFVINTTINLYLMSVFK